MVELLQSTTFVIEFIFERYIFLIRINKHLRKKGEFICFKMSDEFPFCKIMLFYVLTNIEHELELPIITFVFLDVLFCSDWYY